MGLMTAGIQSNQHGKPSDPAYRPAHGVNGWSISGRPIRYLYIASVALCASLMLSAMLNYRAYPLDSNDFFALNSFSRFIRQYPPMLIYNQELLRRFQDLPHHTLFVFMYHPGMMLLLWPLAYLPYYVGYILWVGIGLVACCGAVTASRDGWPLALLLVVAPSTLWTALMGQSSLLVAALLIGGLLLSPRRPLLAGLLIGLATYKPQLGILVPVALVAAGQWRTILAACVTGLCIVVLSTLAFGLAVWPAWFHHLSSITDVRSVHGTDWAPFMATVATNLVTAGFNQGVADIIQVITSLMNVVCVWFCFMQPSGRQAQNSSLQLQVAVLGAATFLATPYAFTYDLPLFTGAILLFVDERRRAKGAFKSREVLAIVVGLMLPCFIVSAWLHGCSSVVVAVMLWTILHRLQDLRREQGRSNRQAHPPPPVGLKA